MGAGELMRLSRSDQVGRARSANCEAAARPRARFSPHSAQLGQRAARPLHDISRKDFGLLTSEFAKSVGRSPMPFVNTREEKRK